MITLLKVDEFVKYSYSSASLEYERGQESSACAESHSWPSMCVPYAHWDSIRQTCEAMIQTDLKGKMRGPMNFKFKIAAAAMLAVCVVASYGQTGNAKPPVKKHVATKKTQAPEPVEVRKLRAPAEPSVADQIQELRHDLEGQINDLKRDRKSTRL